MGYIYVRKEMGVDSVNEPLVQKKGSRKRVVLVAVDFVLLFVAFWISTWFKEQSLVVHLTRYWSAILGFSVIWFIVSSVLGKYSLPGAEFVPIAKTILQSNLISFGIVVILLILFRITDFSRIIVFGSLTGIIVLEIIVFGMWTLAKQGTEIREEYGTKKTSHKFTEKWPSTAEDKKISSSRLKAIKGTIASELGDEMLHTIQSYIDISLESTLVLATNTQFNVEIQPTGTYKSIVNIKRINDTRYINKFFEAVNAKLPKGGLFMCFAETNEQRKERILAKYPPVLNYMVYTVDYIIKRVFPKFSFTKKIYFLLTRGQNRVISRAESLGRLYSCGFEVVDEFYLGSHFVMVARKIKKPAFDMEPTYGPLIKLRRVGRNGKIIHVYKMRTMHPYAEYLQDYIYQKHSLDEGGKFKDDFRISTAGRIMRRLWIDELPMFINLLKGELKIVGVRPLSLHYFSLYTKELQDKRLLSKPGLIPPFYVDKPGTLEEIMDSEMKYLLAYEKHPFRTDFRYFFVAIYNIVFRRYRSN